MMGDGVMSVVAEKGDEVGLVTVSSYVDIVCLFSLHTGRKKDKNNSIHCFCMGLLLYN